MTLVVFTFCPTDSDTLIRNAVKAYRNINRLPDGDVRIIRNNGKPTIEHGREHVSLSHSGFATVCAVSDCVLGCDVQEKKKVDFSHISERVFGKTITDGEEFYRHWSSGEARAKRDGNGLLHGLKMGGGRNYTLFEGYAFALCGGSEPIFFTEER